VAMQGFERAVVKAQLMGGREIARNSDLESHDLCDANRWSLINQPMRSA
jgi:hypothetical protein